jgi:hypothetical protein
MPFLKIKLSYWLIGAIAMSSLAGCSNHAARRYSVGGHEFEIPKNYILKDNTSWIPGVQGDGFAFVANPEASAADQNIVTVNSKESICHPATKPTSDMLFSACSGKSVSSDLEKVFPHEGITFEWEYRAKGSNGNPITVASCSSVRGGEDGLCTSINGFDGLVYSVKFMDSKIKNLPGLIDKVSRLLGMWKIS